MQRFVLALVTLLAALIGAPASAAMVLTPFASFNTLPGGTFYWQNNAAYGGPGSGGQLFTTTTPATPIPNAIPVNFNWAAAGFNNVAATLIFRGIAINSPVVTTGLPGAVANQTGIGFGSFLIAVGPTTVLLGTYNSGTIITNIGATNALFLTNSFPGGLNITSPVAPVPPGFFPDHQQDRPDPAHRHRAGRRTRRLRSRRGGGLLLGQLRAGARHVGAFDRRLRADRPDAAPPANANYRLRLGCSRRAALL